MEFCQEPKQASYQFSKIINKLAFGLKENWQLTLKDKVVPWSAMVQTSRCLFHQELEKWLWSAEKKNNWKKIYIKYGCLSWILQENTSDEPALKKESELYKKDQIIWKIKSRTWTEMNSFKIQTKEYRELH